MTEHHRRFSVLPPGRHTEENLEQVQRYRNVLADVGATTWTTDGWFDVA